MEKAILELVKLMHEMDGVEPSGNYRLETTVNTTDDKMENHTSIVELSSTGFNWIIVPDVLGITGNSTRNALRCTITTDKEVQWPTFDESRYGIWFEELRNEINIGVDIIDSHTIILDAFYEY
jgi:hypothetical protein